MEILANSGTLKNNSSQTTNNMATAPHGERRKLYCATQTANQIIIYIVADRYTDTQQETFFTADQNIANFIVGSHPVIKYKAWVQIWGIGTI